LTLTDCSGLLSFFFLLLDGLSDCEREKEIKAAAVFSYPNTMGMKEGHKKNSIGSPITFNVNRHE
jgi:hypothetical protein